MPASRLIGSVLAVSLLAAAPAFAQADDDMPAMPGLPASMPAPKLGPGQLDAIKRQLDAAPKTPGRAAMMAKLLKLAMAMKANKPVPTEDLIALVAFLRAANPDKASDPAFGAALSQMEQGIRAIQGGENPDLDELKKEFEGY